MFVVNGETHLYTAFRGLGTTQEAAARRIHSGVGMVDPSDFYHALCVQQRRLNT